MYKHSSNVEPKQSNWFNYNNSLNRNASNQYSVYNASKNLIETSNGMNWATDNPRIGGTEYLDKNVSLPMLLQCTNDYMNFHYRNPLAINGTYMDLGKTEYLRSTLKKDPLQDEAYRELQNFLQIETSRDLRTHSFRTHTLNRIAPHYLSSDTYDNFCNGALEKPEIYNQNTRPSSDLLQLKETTFKDITQVNQCNLFKFSEPSSILCGDDLLSHLKPNAQAFYLKDLYKDLLQINQLQLIPNPKVHLKKNHLNNICQCFLSMNFVCYMNDYYALQSTYSNRVKSFDNVSVEQAVLRIINN